MFYKSGVLKIPKNSKEDTCPTTLLKRAARYRCFPVNILRFFVKHLRATTSVLSTNNMCDVLRDLVPYVQYKKREKHS